MTSSDDYIYMDNAATTRVKGDVVASMIKYFYGSYGNASSMHNLGAESRVAVDKARNIIADMLNAESSEIYFTSGGSESDNWALKSVAELYGEGSEIITSAIEHPAILKTCDYLSKRGYKITKVGVDEDGVVNVDEIERAITPNTCLISIMFANNEIGTIQPIDKIGLLAKKYNILFHTDAVQTFGHLPIDVKALNIDLLSASGHKFNGPKGTGFLYVRKGIELPPLIHGGSQENHMRAGTENVAGIVGMGEAAKIADRSMDSNITINTLINNHMTSRILSEIPCVKLNGHKNYRLPNNMNFSFKGVDASSLLAMLNMDHIYASSGSACSSASTEPSHVLKAIGLDDEYIEGSLRLTIGNHISMADANKVVDKIKEYVEMLREVTHV